MTLEIVAALAIAALVLWVVFEPLLSPASPALLLEEPAAAEETRRGVALLALKEIEFDLETGKLSTDDYEMLKQRYSKEALDALAADEANPKPPAAGDDPEALIAAHRKQLRVADAAGLSAPPACVTCGPRPESDALFCSACGRALGASFCTGCGNPLTPDSRFCAGCGTRIAA